MLEIKESTEYVYTCDGCGERYKPRDRTDDSFRIETRGDLPWGWVSCTIDAKLGTDGMDDVVYENRRMGKSIIRDNFVFCCKECMKAKIVSLIEDVSENNLELK